jgi:hypothetical protein
LGAFNWHLPNLEGDKKLGMRRKSLESTWR